MDAGLAAPVPLFVLTLIIKSYLNIEQGPSPPALLAPWARHIHAVLPDCYTLHKPGGQHLSTENFALIASFAFDNKLFYV